MSLPTLEKTWQFNVNQAVTSVGVLNTDCQNTVFRIKQSLIGFGSSPWTVVKSSNSSTTGASDLWVTAANLISVNGSPHSWIVLQQAGTTGGPTQICIDLNSNQYYNFSLILSPAAGFTLTAGTTSARPTASDESVVFNSGQFTSSSPISTVVHAMMSTTGENTRVFIFNAGALGGSFMIENLVDSTIANRAVATAKSGPMAVATYFNAAAWSGRFGSLVCTMFTGTEAYNAATVAAANAGAISNITNAYPITPLSAHSETVLCKGRLGRFSDLWFGSTGVATGSTYPTSPNDKEFIHINPFVLPWNGSIPVMT